MRERDVEKKLIKAIKQLDGRCLKLVCPGNAGVPDRLILLPKGRVCFAETKAPGGKPRPLQEVQIRKLRDLGFRVFVIDDENGIAELVEELTNAK